jgi:ParB-like chromosome segregation protein Spo0J
VLLLKKKVAGETIIVDSQITVMSINAVKEWKDNPRKNEQAVPKLAEIIMSKGQVTPIVVWRKNMTIYKGNTTWKALKSLGKKEVKVLMADFPSERAAIAYGIADNKSSELAQWDEDLLIKLFEEGKLDTKETGFTEKEKNFLFMAPDMDKINRINAAPIKMKDKIVVMICDQSSRVEIIELLENWIKTTGLKNIGVKR